MIRIIKLNAKRALGLSWSKAVSQVLILSGISLLFILIGFLTFGMLSFDVLFGTAGMPSAETFIVLGAIAAIFFVVMSPLVLGIKAWYYAISLNGKGEDISFCFFPFERFDLAVRCIKLSLILAVKKIFIYGAFSVVPIVMRHYANSFSQDAQTIEERFLAFNSLICSTLLLALALFFAYIYCLKYFALPYAFIENQCKSINDAFKVSKEATEGYKGALLLFNLSLVLHYILCLCPVTALYSYPYLQEAKAIYSRFLIENLEMNKAENSSKEKEKI